LFLKDFLQEELLDQKETTKYLLSTVQSAIKNSNALKLEIKDYFDNFKITLENMDEIWLVVCSIHKSEILSYVDKYKFLHKSLMERTSSEHCIKWFQCFLAKNQVWIDSDQNLRKMLFEEWAKVVMDNYKNTTYVLTETDKLLDAFDDSPDNDWFRMHFIDYIVKLCFKQGKLRF